MDRKPHLVSWDVATKKRNEGGLGLRKMRQLNSAFLMKLSWRLETEPNALGARVLKAKYCKGRDLDNIVARRFSCSNAWRGIMETLKLTKRGVGVAVGDGRQTQFWCHRWIDGLILWDQVISAAPAAQLNYRVCDYWKMDMG